MACGLFWPLSLSLSFVVGTLYGKQLSKLENYAKSDFPFEPDAVPIQ